MHPQNASMIDTPLLTSKEVADYLRVDAEQLRNLIRRHGLPVIKRGRLLRFRKSAIDKWLAAGESAGYLTVKDTAARLNVSPRVVYDLVATGQLRCQRVGVGRGTIRIAPEDLETYLKSKRATPGWPFSR